MKYVKMLGLAAVAAAALMAFVGASTASATVLCSVKPTKGTPETEGTTCPEGKAYGSGTVIHAVLDPGTGPAILTNQSGEKQISCEESTVNLSTSNEGSATETVKGSVTTLTFGKCTTPLFFNAPCTVETKKGGTGELHWITDKFHGTLTSSGAEVFTSCSTIFGAVKCTFGSENTDLGTLTGGVMAEEKATMDIESAAIKIIKSESELCPEAAKWDAKYEVTSPKPLYVAGET